LAENNLSVCGYFSAVFSLIIPETFKLFPDISLHGRATIASLQSYQRNLNGRFEFFKQREPINVEEIVQALAEIQDEPEVDLAEGLSDR